LFILNNVQFSGNVKEKYLISEENLAKRIAMEDSGRDEPRNTARSLAFCFKQRDAEARKPCLDFQNAISC
jgi:hypothetical protein